MKFFNLRKIVASALTASVVLSSATILLTSSIKEASASPKAEVQEEFLLATPDLNGKWNVTWKVFGYSYVGKLNLKNDTGKMIVTAKKGKESKTIIQNMRVVPDDSDPNSYTLVGSNVREMNGKPSEDYFPDTFHVQYDNEDDAWTINHVEPEVTSAKIFKIAKN